MPLANNHISTFKTIALVLSALISIFAMWRMSDGGVDAGLLGFAVWVLLPYFSFLGLTYLFERLVLVPRIRQLGAIMAVLILVFTAWTYLSAINDTSSTSALVFLFVPLYVFIGAFIPYLIVVLLTWLAKRQGLK